MLAEEKQAWAVTDESSADWVLTKLAENEAKRQHVTEQYQKMVDRYAKWLEDELGNINASDIYFKLLLEQWAKSTLTDGKKKSINLPSGKVGFRAGTTTYTIGGEKVTGDSKPLLDFVKEGYSEFLKVKESVDWAAFKKSIHVTDSGDVVTAAGEVVPGMTAEKGEPTFYVKTEVAE
jgi:hypothetical protein